MHAEQSKRPKTKKKREVDSQPYNSKYAHLHFPQCMKLEKLKKQF